MLRYKKTTVCIAALCAFTAFPAISADVYLGNAGETKNNWTANNLSAQYKDNNAPATFSVYGGHNSENSGSQGEIVKSSGDITLMFKKLPNDVLLDDIFAGGRAWGTGVSTTVGNTHIIIDTGDSEVMSGDILGGGHAYHFTTKSEGKKFGAISIAGDTLIEMNSGIANGLIFGGGYATGYASNPYDADNPAAYQAESRVGNTHIIINGGTVTEAVIGGGKVRINSEAKDYLKGISTVESVHIEMTGGTVGGIIGGGFSQTGRNKEDSASEMRTAIATVNGNTHIEIKGGTVKKLYNDDINASLQITNDKFDGAIAGGGVAGFGGTDVANNRFSKVESKGDISIQITGATVNGAIYGGAISASGHRDNGANNGDGGIASVINIGTK